MGGLPAGLGREFVNAFTSCESECIPRDSRAVPPGRGPVSAAALSAVELGGCAVLGHRGGRPRGGSDERRARRARPARRATPETRNAHCTPLTAAACRACVERGRAPRRGRWPAAPWPGRRPARARRRRTRGTAAAVEHVRGPGGEDRAERGDAEREAELARGVDRTRGHAAALQRHRAHRRRAQRRGGQPDPDTDQQEARDQRRPATPSRGRARRPTRPPTPMSSSPPPMIGPGARPTQEPPDAGRHRERRQRQRQPGEAGLRSGSGRAPTAARWRCR